MKVSICMEELNLDYLNGGHFPGLTRKAGGALYEAGLVCLDLNNHTSGCSLDVTGDYCSKFNLTWTDIVGEKERRSWGDHRVAAEHGASGIACLLVIRLTKYTVIERSRQGTGFDYWLTNRHNLASENTHKFQKEARLEVSGMSTDNTMSRINSRVRQKTRQVLEKLQNEIPAIVVVVEFGRPLAKVMQYEGSDDSQRTA